MKRYEVSYYAENIEYKNEQTSSWFIFIKLRLTKRWVSYRVKRY